METDKLLRKLEPLIPEKVRHWRRVRQTADTDLCRLLNHEIVRTAYKLLGDFHDRILLSLPPPSLIKGEIELGGILYEQEKWPAGISQDELLQNMAVFGRSGAGKTNVAFHLLSQLVERDLNFLFLDWKMTARHLLPKLKRQVNVYTAGRSLSPLAFNPFVAPPGIEMQVYINHLVDVLADSFTLGDGAKRVLQKAISVCVNDQGSGVTIDQVIKKVDEIPGSGRVHGWKTSALRALESLEFAGIGTEAVSQEALAQKLLNESSVIELDSLNANCKRFLVPLLCHWLYQVRLTKPDREKLRFVVFIEEAHHILHQGHGRSRETLMEMLLRQFREVGIAGIIIDQHPSLISSAVLGNTYVSVILNLKDPTDINKAAGLSCVDASEKDCFSRLPVGQAIIKLQDRWTKPILVQIPLVSVEKGRVADEVLVEYLKNLKESRNYQPRSTGKTLEVGQSAAFEQVQLSDALVTDNHLAFIKDVLKHANDGVKVRYKRLGLSTGAGNKIKGDILKAGVIEQETVSLGTTRKALLRLTRKGRELFGIEKGVATNESMKHAYWKNEYASKYRKKGYQVEVEALRRSGRTDVVALKDGESIAIEIETGQSNVIKNVRSDLLEGFDRVLVVATDRRACDRIEGELARIGMLGMPRVDLVLRGEWGEKLC